MTTLHVAKENRIKSILFIENGGTGFDSLNQEILRTFKDDPLQILIASDAEEAFEFLHNDSNEIAVLIFDQKTPALKKDELTSSIKQQYPDIPIIILSEQAEQQELIDLIGMGISGFICKPWKADDLHREILKAQELYDFRAKSKKEESKKSKEIQLAAEFQEKLLSIDKPINDYFDFDVHYEPISKFKVTGDYFDIISLDNEKFLIISGDVSGHGLKTSFITAILKSLIYPVYVKETLGDTISPSDLLNWLNRELFNFFRYFPDFFFTVSAVVLDGKSGIMKVSGGGQPPIIHIRKNACSTLNTNGLVLGVNSTYDYKEQEILLEKGDCLVLSSDGIYPIGIRSQHFSIDDFKAANISMVKNNSSLTDLVEGVKQKIAPYELIDDVTMISIKVK